jgi:hypothetical protein
LRPLLGLESWSFPPSANKSHFYYLKLEYAEIFVLASVGRFPTFKFRVLPNQGMLARAVRALPQVLLVRSRCGDTNRLVADQTGGRFHKLIVLILNRFDFQRSDLSAVGTLSVAQYKCF